MLTFYAPMNFLGYGIHSYNLIKAYEDKFKEEIAVVPPFGNVYRNDDRTKKWLENRKKITSKEPSIMIFHEEFMFQFAGKPRIGFPVFETEIFSDIALAAMKSVDYLLTTSSWGATILESHGFENVYIVPEGYDPDMFYPDTNIEQRKIRIEKKGITFCHVGKWEARKGSRDILKAFTKAFSQKSERITFLLHMVNPLNANWETEFNQTLSELGYELGNINNEISMYTKGSLTIYETRKPIPSVASIYNNADFGIWLSRAEGWNLPLLECLACGTPALTTTWTGMSEYLQKYPDILSIRTGKREIANDGKYFRGNKGTWVVPDLDEVIEKLQYIGNNPIEILDATMGDIINNTLSFTWQHSATALDFALSNIGSGIMERRFTY